MIDTMTKNTPPTISRKWKQWCFQQAGDNYVLEFFIEMFLDGKPLPRWKFIEDNVNEGFSPKKAEEVYNKVAFQTFLVYGLLMKKWSF